MSIAERPRMIVPKTYDDIAHVARRQRQGFSPENSNVLTALGLIEQMALLLAAASDDARPSAYEEAESALTGGRWTKEEAAALASLINQSAAMLTPEPEPVSPLRVQLSGAGVPGGRAYMLCYANGEPLPNQESCAVEAISASAAKVTVTLFVDGKSVVLGSEEEVLRRVLG